MDLRKNVSTSLAVMEFVENIVTAIEDKTTCYGCFHYSVSGITHQWLKSYLSKRLQYVKMDNHSHFRITCGVPQGSVLGPRSFPLFLSDICIASKLSKLFSLFESFKKNF